MISWGFKTSTELQSPALLPTSPQEEVGWLELCFGRGLCANSLRWAFGQHYLIQLWPHIILSWAGFYCSISVFARIKSILVVYYESLSHTPPNRNNKPNPLRNKLTNWSCPTVFTPLTLTVELHKGSCFFYPAFGGNTSLSSIREISILESRSSTVLNSPWPQDLMTRASRTTWSTPFYVGAHWGLWLQAGQKLWFSKPWSVSICYCSESEWEVLIRYKNTPKGNVSFLAVL